MAPTPSRQAERIDLQKERDPLGAGVKNMGFPKICLFAVNFSRMLMKKKAKLRRVAVDSEVHADRFPGEAGRTSVTCPKFERVFR